jgi:hypothetical protein
MKCEMLLLDPDPTNCTLYAVPRRVCLSVVEHDFRRALRYDGDRRVRALRLHQWRPPTLRGPVDAMGPVGSKFAGSLLMDVEMLWKGGRREGGVYEVGSGLGEGALRGVWDAVMKGMEWERIERSGRCDTTRLVYGYQEVF